MHPIFDADALLLLALITASKRHPASLAEIIIALAGIRPELPGAARLRDAFSRLSTHGLLHAQDNGFTLGAASQTLLAKVPAKGEIGERVFLLKQYLSDFDAPADQPPVGPTTAEAAAAIKAWQASLPPLTKSEKFAKRIANQRGPGRAPSRTPAHGRSSRKGH